MKRTIDIILGLIGLLLALPIMLVVIILLYCKLGHPILFRQQRVGLNGAIFKMIKFRTMQNISDSQGQDLPDAQRLTKFGQFLRSTSLDELPELINVLKGDMSLVGPRPLLVEYIPLYSKEQWRRHEVKPGITGLAQIQGRNMLSWDEKFTLDVDYVNNHNLLLDFKILLLTIKKVFLRKDISAHNHVTAEKFTGNKKQ